MASAGKVRLSYVELRARSAFSFLRGATLPEDLAVRAGALGYGAVALGDEGGLYGSVRFHDAARSQGVRPLVAGDLTLEGLGSVRLLVENDIGYRNLCRLFTLAHARRPKGEHAASLAQLCEYKDGLIALLGACDGIEAAEQVARSLGRERAVAEVQRHLDPRDERRNRAMLALAEQLRLRTVATGDVRHALPAEQRVLDVLTCIREGLTLEHAGTRLSRNADRHLHPPEEMVERFADLPRVVDTTRELAERCAFGLGSLPYTFPDCPVPAGETQQSHLERLTFASARERYGERYESDERVQKQLRHELAVIARLGLAGYFLIVRDLIDFCRDKKILVQGRGSAANSAVCYALGITAVDPVAMELLFERFLSEERGEWPDIDLDLPSGDKREEVIQHVYKKYGPRGAAMCAEVITYRSKLAVREVGKVLGLEPDVIDALSRSESWLARGDEGEDAPRGEARLARAGVIAAGRAALLPELIDAIVGLPRHLSQHSGGMIIAKGALDELVPLEPAAMPNRTVLQWDKHDCESLGLIKIDLLGLGMMAALEECLDTLKQRGTPIDLAHLPPNDPASYDAAQRADTVGVFQIESRAQMATLPRLKPKRFYDLVVSVGLIRPGPIVGKMVHPYLNRRAGREAITYPHPDLEPVLKRTLGVPLFQEQLMRMAMVAAGLTGGEAQDLRKVMSRSLTQRRASERMRQLEQRLRDGMKERGYDSASIEQVVGGIQAFAEYGFPESHSASFALLVYASLYLKVHHPAVFLVALLNNQPLGFYAPATLVKDAQRHGVHVRTACVVHSAADAVVLGERDVRLGLRSVAHISTATIERLLAARRTKPFASVSDLVVRCGLERAAAEALAEAGAFASLGVSRRQALWQVHGALRAGGLAPPPREDASPLTELKASERTLADYSATRLTVGPHLISLARKQLEARGALTAVQLTRARHGSRVSTGGMVIVRQRPSTANGVVFLTLEDETGLSNIILAREVFEAHRTQVLSSSVLWIEGEVQSRDGVVAIKARRVEPVMLDATSNLPGSHDFH